MGTVAGFPHAVGLSAEVDALAIGINRISVKCIFVFGYSGPENRAKNLPATQGWVRR